MKEYVEETIFHLFSSILRGIVSQDPVAIGVTDPTQGPCDVVAPLAVGFDPVAF